MKKVVYISGSRADFGLMERTLKELCKYVDLRVIATNMHLSPHFGHTVGEIEKEFKVHKVDNLLDKDTLAAMSESLGVAICGITSVVEEIEPHIILVEGDRGESLAGAIVGAHLNIPVVHHGGGDVSGSIDNKIRYAITMFADYHLVGNKESGRRLAKLEIPRERIFIVGEPGLDDIYAGDFTKPKDVAKKLNLDIGNPSILLIQHPNTNEYTSISEQTKEVLEAIGELGMQTVAIYPNADAGGRTIIEMLEKYRQNFKLLKVFRHIERRDFLGLMNVCSVMIGNSSSGFIESPCFKKPFVHIGTRQKGRLSAGNIVEVAYNREDIIEGVRRALYDPEFKRRLERIRNPYGDGKAYSKITEIVLRIIGQ